MTKSLADELIPLNDLPMFWQGRANALRILDESRDQSDPATLLEAWAYEICANELRAALRTPPGIDARTVEACAKVAEYYAENVYRTEVDATRNDSTAGKRARGRRQAAREIVLAIRAVKIRGQR